MIYLSFLISSSSFTSHYFLIFPQTFLSLPNFPTCPHVSSSFPLTPLKSIVSSLFLISLPLILRHPSYPHFLSFLPIRFFPHFYLLVFHHSLLLLLTSSHLHHLPFPHPFSFTSFNYLFIFPHCLWFPPLTVSSSSFLLPQPPERHQKRSTAGTVCINILQLHPVDSKS